MFQYISCKQLKEPLLSSAAATNQPICRAYVDGITQKSATSIEEISQPAIITPTPKQVVRELRTQVTHMYRLYFQKSKSLQVSGSGPGVCFWLCERFLTGPSHEFPKENIYIKNAFGKPIKI